MPWRAVGARLCLFGVKARHPDADGHHGEAEKAGCLRQEFHQALAAPRDVGREEMDGRLHRGREELDRLWAPAEQRQDHPENNAQTQSGQSNPLDSE